MDFASSSHLKNWILAKEELDRRREQANRAGIEYVLQLRREHGEGTDGLEPPSTTDELKLLAYYTQMLLKREQVKKLCPRKVVATAITFLKRFYLDQSCMQHDMMRIVLACVYISGKACEHYIDAEKLKDVFGGAVKAKEVLLLETSVLQALNFDLVVYQPYKSVDAMVEELRVASKDPASHKDLSDLFAKQAGCLELVHKLAYSFTDSIIRSDAPLLLRPQQQALCAVCHALKHYGMREEATLQRYSAMAGGGDRGGTVADAGVLAALQELVRKGDALAAEGHVASSKEEVQAIDKKLRAFNPAMDTSSKLYKKLKKKRKRDDDE